MLLHHHVPVSLMVSVQFLVRYCEDLHILPYFWQCQILVVLVLTALVKKRFFALGNFVVSVASIIPTLTLRLLQRDNRHSFQVESYKQKYPNCKLLRTSAFTATARFCELMPFIVLMVHLKRSGVISLNTPYFKSMNTYLGNSNILKSDTTTRYTLWMEWIIFLGAKWRMFQMTSWPYMISRLFLLQWIDTAKSVIYNLHITKW